jgi:hypothetical protein
MKNLKIALLALSLLLSASLFAAEAPMPKPSAKKPTSYPELLPPDVRAELYRYILGNNNPENIETLARAISSIQNLISAPAMIEILKSLPHVTAMQLAQRLQGVSIMQNPQVATWFLLNTLASDTPEKIQRANTILNIPNLDINIQNENGDSVLMLATRTGNDALVQRLLNAGANPNLQSASGNTALINAANFGITRGLGTKYHGHPELVRALLANGADINLKDASGRTALDYAIKNRQPEIIKLLEEAAARKRKSEAENIPTAKKMKMGKL